MNELRMYVEHLFQGKVLTAENIELKEEIYGNLVARYEDLVAGGMSEDEALARTKESFTSLDDVFAEEPSDAEAASDEGAVPAAGVEGDSDEAECAGSNGGIAAAVQTGAAEGEDAAR
ncbi:permease prefix domain 1-containing protein, partial [Collinsella sp.]|uniref:permease prefix domain 1-containing protein n=1 Tax=Collinsella sp. TaxID=1965294 RepID=UPI003FEF7199